MQFNGGVMERKNEDLWIIRGKIRFVLG